MTFDRCADRNNTGAATKHSIAALELLGRSTGQRNGIPLLTGEPPNAVNFKLFSKSALPRSAVLQKIRAKRSLLSKWCCFYAPFNKEATDGTTVSYALQQVKAHLLTKSFPSVISSTFAMTSDTAGVIGSSNPAVTVPVVYSPSPAGQGGDAGIASCRETFRSAFRRFAGPSSVSPLKLLMELVARNALRVGRCDRVGRIWRRMYFVDGMSFMTPRHTGTGSQTLWEGQEPSRNQLRLSDSQVAGIDGFWRHHSQGDRLALGTAGIHLACRACLAPIAPGGLLLGDRPDW